MWAFMFTDIQNSTQILFQDEVAAARMIFQHRKVVRECVALHGGRVITYTGDGAFVAFPVGAGRHVRPLECAMALQLYFSQHGYGSSVVLRLRITVHLGEAVFAEGDLIGLEVHRTQRLLNFCEGGQILVTPEVITRFTPSREMRLHNKGFHELKGFGGVLQQVFELQHPHKSLPINTHSKELLPDAGQRKHTVLNPEAYVG